MGGTPGAVFIVLESTSAALAEVEHVVRLAGLVCLAGLATTAAIAWVVAGQILAPVRLVRRTASRITRADLSRRIEVRGRDDVAALALTFNAMLDRLQAAFTAQQRFAAAGLHLRAPLHVLRQRVGHDATAQRAVNQMAGILDDLELLAASEAPGFVQPAPVDLGVLVDDVVDSARSVGGRQWRVEERTQDVALINGPRVRAALLRLTRSAEQQTSAGDTLTLGARVDGEAVELWVSDRGPGLSAEAAAQVLERYGDAVPDTVGPGLGLAVVRAVADAHQGSAWVETTEGDGATFGLRLPLHRPPAEADGPFALGRFAPESAPA